MVLYMCVTRWSHIHTRKRNVNTRVCLLLIYTYLYYVYTYIAVYIHITYIYVFVHDECGGRAGAVYIQIDVLMNCDVCCVCASSNIQMYIYMASIQKQTTTCFRRRNP